MSTTPDVDLLGAARAGGHQLGAQIADLTIELAAQHVMGNALRQRVTELEGELARSQQTAELLQRHVADLESSAPARDDGSDEETAAPPAATASEGQQP